MSLLTSNAKFYKTSWDLCTTGNLRRKEGVTCTELRVWYYYSLKYVPGNHIRLCDKVSKEVTHTAALLLFLGKRSSMFQAQIELL